MPKISIIVPVYKVEQYIHQCLESILQQSYKDYEILLVDDCSPDQCGKICEDYAKNNACVKVFHHKKNRGLSAVRNTGMEHAFGEWIMFVDSDDWIECDTLERLEKCMLDDADLVVFGAIQEYEDKYGKIKQRKYMIPDSMTACTPKELGDVLVRLEKCQCFQYTWNKVYRASVIRERNAEFKNIERMEDFVFNAFLWTGFRKIYCIDYAAYHYRRFAAGETLALKYSPKFFNLSKERYSKEKELLSLLGADSEENIYEIQYAFLKHLVSVLARNETVNPALTYSEKYKAARGMVKDNEVQDFLRRFKPHDMKSKCICFIFKLRILPCLLLLGKVAKSMLMKG